MNEEVTVREGASSEIHFLEQGSSWVKERWQSRWQCVKEKYSELN